MKSITFYSELDTPVHRLEPMTKALYVFAAIVVPPLAGGKPAFGAMILVSAMLLLTGRVLRKTAPMLGLSALLLVTIVVIQGIFRAGNVTPLLSLGSVTFYKEGLWYAWGVVLNVVNIVLGFSVLILTTKPSDIAESFVRVGLSPKLGYVMGSVFQIVPQMSESMETITDAQRSRGMETEGGLLTRIKAFFPLISPVVMSSLIATRERAIALEVRGFSATGPRTYLAESGGKPLDKIIKLSLCLVMAGAVAWRVFLWLS